MDYRTKKNKYQQTHEWEEACVHTRRTEALRKRRLEKFYLSPSDTVLDLGCGDGLNISIFQKIGVKNVIGLDISPQLLTEAKKNNPNNKFFLGSAEKLPFEDQQFSVVLVDSVFHHLLDYDRVLSEINRVLKPGGLLCFIEPHKSYFRSILDFVTLLPGSKFIPFIGERSITYREEIHLMRHWLATEQIFLQKLPKWHFQKIFCFNDFLSIMAQYRKLHQKNSLVKLKKAKS